ncbi:hypothetical protein ABZP36_012724 [Zizania latifolia]
MRRCQHSPAAPPSSPLRLPDPLPLILSAVEISPDLALPVTQISARNYSERQSQKRLPLYFVVGVHRSSDFDLSNHGGIKGLKAEVSRARIQLLEPIKKGSGGVEYLRKAFADRYGSPSSPSVALRSTALWISTSKDTVEVEWNEHVNSFSVLPATDHAQSLVATLRSGHGVPDQQQSTVPAAESIPTSDCNCDKNWKTQPWNYLTLTELLDNFSDVSTDKIMEVMVHSSASTSSSSDEITENRKQMLARVFLKSLQIDDTVFKKAQVQWRTLRSSAGVQACSTQQHHMENTASGSGSASKQLPGATSARLRCMKPKLEPCDGEFLPLPATGAVSDSVEGWEAITPLGAGNPFFSVVMARNHVCKKFQMLIPPRFYHLLPVALTPARRRVVADELLRRPEAEEVRRGVDGVRRRQPALGRGRLRLRAHRKWRRRRRRQQQQAGGGDGGVLPGADTPRRPAGGVQIQGRHLRRANGHRRQN